MFREKYMEYLHDSNAREIRKENTIDMFRCVYLWLKNSFKVRVNSVLWATWVALLLSTMPAHGQEERGLCSEIISMWAYCDTWVYEIDKNWNLDVEGFEKILYELEEDNMSIDAIVGIVYDVDYIQSEVFQEKMIPVFQDIQKYSWFTIMWRDLIAFLRLHQHISNLEIDMAEDMAEEIISVFSRVLDMRFILESHWLISKLV